MDEINTQDIAKAAEAVEFSKDAIESYRDFLKVSEEERNKIDWSVCHYGKLAYFEGYIAGRRDALYKEV